MTTAAEHDAAQAPVPYSGELLYGVPDDLIVPGVLDLDAHGAASLGSAEADADARVWVPQAPGDWFRPLLLSVSQGYFVNILRVTRAGVLSRHRHAGPVHAVTLRGRWHYLEHDWWAEEGGYSFEPPGDIHTLEVPADVPEMVTLFHVTGAYIYVEPDGTPTGVEDVFSKIDSARAHYERVGLGADHVDQFIR